jgi:hypothetical protein
MWRLAMPIQEGPYEGQYLFSNVMLFDGALYSLAQLLKATGRGDALKSGKIPPLSELVDADEKFVVGVVKQVDKYRIDQGEWDGKGPKPMKNEVKSYFPADQLQTAGAGGSSSLMP